MQLAEDGTLQIDSHPTHNILAKTDEDKCTVCLCKFDDDNAKHTLECGHTYHTDCIMHWFRSGNPSCPLCRNEGRSTNIMTPEEAIKRLKQISKRKDVPSRLKRAAAHLREAEHVYKNAKRSLAAFEREHRSVLGEIQRKRRRVMKAEVKLAKRESNFILPNRPYQNVQMPLIIRQEDALGD
jgi:hypothetical protein